MQCAKSNYQSYYQGTNTINHCHFKFQTRVLSGHANLDSSVDNGDSASHNVDCRFEFY